MGERLFKAGLLDAFDSAAKARDRDGMIGILNQVELEGDWATNVADGILADPAKYGYDVKL